MLTYFVIVPSISEMTIWSVLSQRKIRAVQTANPEYDDVTENWTVFGPGLRHSCFCKTMRQSCTRLEDWQLTS